MNGLNNKVLTYEDYRAVSGVFQNIDPQPGYHPASVSSAGWWGGGWSIFWKTPDIGLASYSIISLRVKVSLTVLKSVVLACLELILDIILYILYVNLPTVLPLLILYHIFRIWSTTWTKKENPPILKRVFSKENWRELRRGFLFVLTILRDYCVRVRSLLGCSVHRGNYIPSHTEACIYKQLAHWKKVILNFKLVSLGAK